MPICAIMDKGPLQMYFSKCNMIVQGTDFRLWMEHPGSHAMQCIDIWSVRASPSQIQYGPSPYSSNERLDPTQQSGWTHAFSDDLPSKVTALDIDLAEAKVKPQLGAKPKPPSSLQSRLSVSRTVVRKAPTGPEVRKTRAQVLKEEKAQERL